MMNHEAQKDIWVSRLVVIIIGLSALASLGVMIILAAQGWLPDLPVALGSAVIGGLAGLLARSLIQR